MVLIVLDFGDSQHKQRESNKLLVGKLLIPV